MAILGKSRMHVVVESLSVNSVVSDGWKWGVWVALSLMYVSIVKMGACGVKREHQWSSTAGCSIWPVLSLLVRGGQQPLSADEGAEVHLYYMEWAPKQLTKNTVCMYRHAAEEYAYVLWKHTVLCRCTVQILLLYMYLNILMTKWDDGVTKRRDHSFQIWCGSCTFRLASYSCSDLLDVQICLLIYAREGGINSTMELTP